MISSSSSYSPSSSSSSSSSSADLPHPHAGHDPAPNTNSRYSGLSAMGRMMLCFGLPFILCSVISVFQISSFLITIDTEYSPVVSLSSSPFTYTVQSPGQASFGMLSYYDEFSMTKSTTPLNSTLNVNDTTVNATLVSTEKRVDLSCHYSVYTNITALARPRGYPADTSSAVDGDQLQFTVPHCAALNTFRLSTLVFIVALGFHCFVLTALDVIVAVQGSCYKQPADDSSVPPSPSITPPVQPVTPYNPPLANFFRRLGGQPPYPTAPATPPPPPPEASAQAPAPFVPPPPPPPRTSAAIIACMWTTLVVMSVVMVGAGVTSVVSMWGWVSGSEWMGASVTGWPAGVTALQVVSWAVTGAGMWAVGNHSKKEMRRLRDTDPSVDTTMLRWTGACCQRTRVSTGYDDQLLGGGADQ